MLEETYLKNAMIPLRYKKDQIITPSKKDEEVFKYIKNVKDNIVQFVSEGLNLLLCSNFSGNGKTSLSIKLLKEYIYRVGDKGFKYDTPALFINVPNFMNEKKLSIEDISLKNKVRDIESKVLSAKLVVFDDVADKNLSDYELSQLYFWIDNRTSNMKSCIYTTNQLPNQLEKTLTGKLYSRIVGYSNVRIITDGDHRAC